MKSKKLSTQELNPKEELNKLMKLLLVNEYRAMHSEAIKRGLKKKRERENYK